MKYKKIQSLAAYVVRTVKTTSDYRTIGLCTALISRALALISTASVNRDVMLTVQSTPRQAVQNYKISPGDFQSFHFAIKFRFDTESMEVRIHIPLTFLSPKERRSISDIPPRHETQDIFYLNYLTVVVSRICLRTATTDLARMRNTRKE
jgi:hypothetical protein